MTTTSYPLWTIDNDTITRLVEEGGIVAPKGPAGSMLLFHGNLVHASGSNLTPWSRWILYLSLNRCDNAIRRFKRPTWIANRDFTPIEMLPDDCLLTLCARAARRGGMRESDHEPAQAAARARRDAGKPLRVGLIGAGKFGSMFLAQARRTPGLHLLGVADLDPARARAALARVGWPAEQISARSARRGDRARHHLGRRRREGADRASGAGRGDRRDRPSGRRHPPRAGGDRSTASISSW